MHAMPAAVSIRKLAPGDAARWREIRLRALREDPAAFLATHDEDERVTAADLAHRLAAADPGAAVLGAFDGEELIGTAGIGRNAPAKTRHRGLLWGMYVAPEARGRGIGGALLQRAIEHARSVPELEQLELSVAVSATSAQRLYVRLGFERIGRHARAMKDGDAYEDVERMVLWLRGPRGAGFDDETELASRLAARSPGECVPVLLEAARAHAARKRPADVRAQYERDPFVAPAPSDLRDAHRLDGLALAAAAEFEAVLLSPLAPLASCAAVSPSSQDRIVTTNRGTEVVSDPTNVLALECARRLARDRTADVRLCTIHQTVRAQRVPPGRGLTQHFRMLALAEAGRARGEHAFEVDAFVRHLRVCWSLLDAREREGARHPARRATLLAAPAAAPIATRLRARLNAELPGLELVEGVLESGYYAGLRLLFGANDAHGEHVNLSDTGLFDWVAKLTSDARLRFVATGLGLPRI